MRMESQVFLLADNPSLPLCFPLGKLAMNMSRRPILTPSPLSTFVGALGQAFTADSLGRRGSILIWAAIFTIGTAIQTGTAFSIVQITIGRFIAGLGVGAMSGTVLLHFQLEHDKLTDYSKPSYHFTMERRLLRPCVECFWSCTSFRLSLGEHLVLLRLLRPVLKI